MHRAIKRIAGGKSIRPNYEIQVKEVKYRNMWRRKLHCSLSEESGIAPLGEALVYRRRGSTLEKIPCELKKEEMGYFQKNTVSWETTFSPNESQSYKVIFIKDKEKIPCLLTGTFCAKEIKSNLENVFVSYAYRPKHFRKKAFKRALKKILSKVGLKPIFWDEITERGHFDCKICTYIQSSLFILFEFSDNNSNVAFELGLAIGIKKDYFILRKKALTDEMPSDIRGIDRIEYGTYRELENKLLERINQRYSALLPLS